MQPHPTVIFSVSAGLSQRLSDKACAFSSLFPSRAWTRAGRICLFMLAMFWCLTPHLLAQTPVHKWVSPAGGGTGEGAAVTGSPAMFTTALVNTWLSNLSLVDLTVHFMPGDYNVGVPTLEIIGDVNRSVSLVGELGVGGQKPRLILDSLQNHGPSAQYWTTSVMHHWLIFSKRYGSPVVYDHLKRIVIENLELDGNFANQGAWTSEANATGYKSFALDLSAITGRIRNVTVRNFGSVGDVPASSIHQVAGVEAFPVTFRTIDEGQLAQGNDSHPWVVENVEVTDFHSVHGGYATRSCPTCSVLLTQP